MLSTFDARQWQALIDLTRTLNRQSSTLLPKSPEPASASSVLIDPEFSNVFGVFGPRGAGKSTILEWLFRLATDKKPQETLKPSLEGAHGQLATEFATVLQTLQKNLWILPPIDCSIIPSDIHPGSAILAQGAIQFERLSKDLDDDWRSLRDDLKELTHQHGTTAPAYRDLWLEVAGSPKDYLVHIAKATRERFQLRTRIRDWANDLLNKMGKRSLIVLLDDFDLAEGDQVRNWQMSLLDELHQRKILFVISADFHRLQHLAWNPKTESDDKTGRALLHKLLPWNHRISLEPWQAKDRRKFVEMPGHLSAYVEELEEDSCKDRLLHRLLPIWPRGLNNLQSKLQELTRQIETTAGHETQRTRIPMRDMLALLATCREESLLARQLREQGLEGWLDILHFSKDDLLPEAWRDTVEAAQQRCGTQNGTLDAFRGLEPLSPRPDISEGRPPREQWRRKLSTSYEHDPSWHDPLRHDELWIAPLRDAKRPDVALWAELLLCLAMNDDHSSNTQSHHDQANHNQVTHDQATTSPPEENSQSDGEPKPPESTQNTSYPPPSIQAIRRRLRFLDMWVPLKARLDASQLSVDTTFDTGRTFFDEQKALLYLSEPQAPDQKPKVNEPPVRTLLFWTQWHTDPSTSPPRLRAEIGWQPLLQALREVRDPTMPDELATLDVDLELMTGNPPSCGSSKTLSFVPGEPWALVLLTDGLDRCPWRLFSVKRDLALSTRIPVAAAFVSTAFLYALELGQPTTEPPETDSPATEQPATEQPLPTSKPLDELLGMLRQRNADAWRLLGQTELLERLRIFFEGDVLEQRARSHGDSELRRAALAFFQADVFLAPRALALAER